MVKGFATFAVLTLTGCAAQSGWHPTVSNNPQFGYGHYQRQYQAASPAGYYHATPADYPPPASASNGYPQNGTTYPAPQYSDANSRIAQDQHDCEIQARAAANPNAGERAKDAVIGGLFGAALGAAVGAVAGDPGNGAAIGAAAGGIGNTARGAINADEDYRRAYSNCLRARGQQVFND